MAVASRVAAMFHPPQDSYINQFVHNRFACDRQGMSTHLRNVVQLRRTASSIVCTMAARRRAITSGLAMSSPKIVRIV